MISIGAAMQRLHHVALLLASLVTFGCGSGWKAYSPPDKQFTIQMPGEPTVQTNADGWQEVSANLTDEKLLFSVRYKDFPAELTPADFKRMADFSRDGLIARQGNKLVSEKSISLNGYTGREMEVSIGQFDDVTFSRDYAVAKRYYILSAQIPKKNSSSPNIKKFFDSFQVSSKAGS
jgi:hypothetical protein